MIWENLQYFIINNALKRCSRKKVPWKSTKNIDNFHDDHGNLPSYHNIKDEIEKIYEKKRESARIRSKCLWYNEGEKPSKLFLNLEKRRGIQGQISELIVNNQEIMHQNKIKNEL